LVEFYHPLRIYLFGSEARNDSGPDSDLDFLVVLPDDTPDQLFRSGEIYTRLSGLEYPKDVIPWRKTDFEGRAAYVRASLPATVIREAGFFMSPEGFLAQEVGEWLTRAQADSDACAVLMAAGLYAEALYHTH